MDAHFDEIIIKVSSNVDMAECEMLDKPQPNGIPYKVYARFKGLTFFALFDTERSWWGKTADLDPTTLPHEQTHFALAEAIARITNDAWQKKLMMVNVMYLDKEGAQRAIEKAKQKLLNTLDETLADTNKYLSSLQDKMDEMIFPGGELGQRKDDAAEK